jgi:hypothetical protein
MEWMLPRTDVRTLILDVWTCHEIGTPWKCCLDSDSGCLDKSSMKQHCALSGKSVRTRLLAVRTMVLNFINYKTHRMSQNHKLTNSPFWPFEDKTYMKMRHNQTPLFLSQKNKSHHKINDSLKKDRI